MAINIQKEVTLNHPVEQVFDFIANPLNDPQWCRSVKEMQQIEGHGPALGAKYQSVHNPGDELKPMKCDIEILAFEKPRYIRWKVVDEMHTMFIEYHLNDLGNQTRLTQTSNIKFGFFAGLIAPIVIKPKVAREVEGQFEKLREVLDDMVGVES
jgi:uncharacterized protein YndB with AHSA1/START domain